MTDSILGSVKKVLGIAEDDETFDVDVLMHINTAFSILNQLGIGPDEGFEISDSSVEWSSYIGQDKNKNSIKTYVYLKVRLLFDPPSTSFAIEAMEKQVIALEWRINVNREEAKYSWPNGLL